MYGKPKKKPQSIPVEQVPVEQLPVAQREKTTIELAQERLAKIKELAEPYNGKLGYNIYFYLLDKQKMYNEGLFSELLSLPLPTEEDFRVK